MLYAVQAMRDALFPEFPEDERKGITLPLLNSNGEEIQRVRVRNFTPFTILGQEPEGVVPYVDSPVETHPYTLDGVPLLWQSFTTNTPSLSPLAWRTLEGEKASPPVSYDEMPELWIIPDDPFVAYLLDLWLLHWCWRWPVAAFMAHEEGGKVQLLQVVTQKTTEWRYRDEL